MSEKKITPVTNLPHIHLDENDSLWEIVLDTVKLGDWSLTSLYGVNQNLFYRIQECVECCRKYQRKRDALRQRSQK